MRVILRRAFLPGVREIFDGSIRYTPPSKTSMTIEIDSSACSANKLGPATCRALEGRGRAGGKELGISRQRVGTYLSPASL